jgi:O-antigen chain-terminating methyltransferase
MRRIIEELVETRKKKQEDLRKTLENIGRLTANKGFFSKLFGGKKHAEEVNREFQELNDQLNELITIQDKEWDAYSNNHSSTVFKSLEWKIEKLEAEYANIKTLLVNFGDLEQSLRRLIGSIDEKSGEKSETLSHLQRMREQLSPYQYSDFEQRFRGDEQAVKEQLNGYIPLFAPAGDAAILDIGCGRGEFLELLREEGKKGEGIDLSESMLTIAREKGLNCTHADALDYLKQQPAKSLGGIFSSQVIEHLEPGYLRDLVIEAFRALRKNAVIVLETVNPLSLLALSSIYFLDVTHCKPLHPEFMRYLLENTGFSDVDIVYTGGFDREKLEAISPENHLAREFNTNVDKLNRLLYASPAYAVTGIKK